jgi:uncharacterized protein
MLNFANFQKGMKRILVIILAICVVIYMMLCLAIYIFQKRIVFVPKRSSDPPPGDLNIREVYFPTGDGQMLHGWWMPVDSSEYTLLFFHGNGGCVQRCEERMRFSRELGFSTLMIDYRGYGKSTGSIKKEEDIYEDGRAALKFITDSLNIPFAKLIVWGWSLGGGVAVDVCQDLQIKALVLEGTFYNIDDIASINYPIFPVRWFLNYHFNSGEKINNIKAPLFFIHSKEDRTIPFEQGRKLFNAATGTKDFIEISGSHNHGYYENRGKIINMLKQFLKPGSEMKHN